MVLIISRVQIETVKRNEHTAPLLLSRLPTPSSSYVSVSLRQNWDQACLIQLAIALYFFRLASTRPLAQQRAVPTTAAIFGISSCLTASFPPPLPLRSSLPRVPKPDLRNPMSPSSSSLSARMGSKPRPAKRAMAPRPLCWASLHVVLFGSGEPKVFRNKRKTSSPQVSNVKEGFQ